MYPLTLELIDFLQSTNAQRELSSISKDDLSTSNSLAVLTRLRKSYTPEQAAVIFDQALLRRRAMAKFTNAGSMYFTDEALQQSTGLEAATYHAEIFKPLELESPLADLGCGLGGDTLAFATHYQVLAVENDAVRLKLAQLNIEACGYSHRVRFICADWTTLELDVKAAFIDPARRVSGSEGNRKRVFHLNEMQPSISTILSLQRQVKDVAVKVSPGIHHNEIPAQAEVLFVSSARKMKEALLCFGKLRHGAATSAVVLPQRCVIDSQFPVKVSPVQMPGKYLFEPDAAVIRAGLVQHLATMLGVSQIDSQIAYLTGDSLVSSPFVEQYKVLRHGPFSLKNLNRWMREMCVGQFDIKKRGSAIDVDQFKKRIRSVKRGVPATIFFTRVMDKPWMLLTD